MDKVIARSLAEPDEIASLGLGETEEAALQKAGFTSVKKVCEKTTAEMNRAVGVRATRELRRALGNRGVDLKAEA